jgi:hypothetical protein
MSRSNGDGLPLRAALKASKHCRLRAQRAAEASATVTVEEVPQHDDDNEREEAEDGSTGSSGHVAGGTA